jgi:hypothetical protein
MQRFRTFALVGLLSLTGLFSLTGCGCLQACFGWGEKEPKKVKETDGQSKYRKLSEKAEKGDVKAARELAKWCYTHDATNDRAKYWLAVAARNGDKGSARVAEVVQDWQ